MKVSKIFKILITVVVCVLLGAFVINVLLPNGSSTVINAVEDNIFKATGISFDFNNDGHAGQTGNQQYKGTEGDADGVGKGTVEGFN